MEAGRFPYFSNDNGNPEIIARTACGIGESDDCNITTCSGRMFSLETAIGMKYDFY